MSRWNEAKVTDKRGGRQEVPSLIKLPLNIFTEILKIVSHCSLWWWLQIRLDLPTPTPVRIFCVLLVITTGSFEILLNMSVSQSCAILKSEKFWRATGQSKLAGRMENCSIGQSAVVWVRKANTGSSCCCQPFVCEVWLSSGLPGFLTFNFSLIVSSSLACIFLGSISKQRHIQLPAAYSLISPDNQTMLTKNTGYSSSNYDIYNNIIYLLYLMQRL